LREPPATSWSTSPATRSERTPKVLYIGGYGRSGSTLVGRVLGESPDAICVGETCYLCTRGLLNDVECGCGQPFRSCSFWEAVGKRAFGGWERVDTARLTEIDHITSRLRTLPFYLLPSVRPRFASAVNDYVAWLTRLYEAIKDVSGAGTIVETSKDPNFALLLTRIAYDVRIIHLVRDSRAVAYSWTRSKRMPSPIGEQKFMPRFKPATTASSWLVSNVAFHALAARHQRYLRITYESFVDDPLGALERLSEFAEQPLVLDGMHLNGRKVRLGDHHIFSGNPMRASTGWVDIRLDNEWQARMQNSHFLKVTAITWPLLRRYGYAVGRSANARNAVGSTVEHSNP
jgi:hypothetical protein